MTALFFLLLIELCMRTGLMPSNRLHQKFFTHSRLAMQLTDAAGMPVFVSATRTHAPQRDIRTNRMEVDGGALLWQEDLSLLHEQQRRLTLTRDTLLRARRVLREEHTIRKRLLRLMLRRQLSEELEAILAAKRPLLRAFREQLMATDDEAAVTLLIRRLNLLSSYLKKRCVLFLKGQEDGYIRADELSMAVSETCTYLRPLGLRVGVEWAQQESLPEADALAVRTQRQRSRSVTTASIRAGLDLMPDGLLFARADHSAVLVNIAMLHFMERLCGRQYRNAAVFWQDLLAFDAPTVAEKELRTNAVLFRFAAGDVWLVQRVQLAGDLDGWQLTASCVTELDAVTRELAAKNEALTNMIGAQKDLLARFEKAERHRALHEITSRVHDILGQRISMLQQLLASAAPKDALDTIVRIDSLLESVPLAQEAHPVTLLADMTDTYRRLGIRIALMGKLPRNLRRARAFAAIIREALSNAVCHGRTNEIRITLTERRLRVRDNGIGCVALRPGGGLAGMIRRVNELGGQLTITHTPHFELDAQIGEKQDD